MTEAFRCRVYVGEELTRARAMDYACSPGGLSGESRRYGYPEWYYRRYLVEDDGWLRMGRRQAQIVAGLLRDGWVERVVVERDVPEGPEMFGPGMHPAHRSLRVTYRATDKGRREFAEGWKGK